MSRPESYVERLQEPLTISQSGLKAFLADPQGWRMGLAGRESSGFFGGTLVDAMLLGDVDQCALYVVSPYDRYTSKEAKDWRDGMVADGKLPIKESELSEHLQSLDNMASNAGLLELLYGPSRRHVLDAAKSRNLVTIAEAARASLDGQAQVQAWFDVPVSVDGTEVAVTCGCLFDFIKHGSTTVFDLKKSSDWTSPEDYSWSVLRYGYHLQAAWYLQAAQANGIACDQFGHVLIEMAGLGRSVIIPFSDELVDIGQRLMAEGLQKFAECYVRDSWPSPWDSVRVLELPRRKALDGATDFGRQAIAREGLGVFK